MARTYRVRAGQSRLVSVDARNPDGANALGQDIAETEVLPTLPFRVIAPGDHFRSRPLALDDALALTVRLGPCSFVEVEPEEYL